MEWRLAAMDLLCRDDSAHEADVECLRPFLSASQPESMQLAALRGLARIPQLVAAEEILSAWPRLLPGVRSAAMEVLLRRPDWTLAMLAAWEHGSVRDADLSLAQRQRLLNSRNEKISALAKQVFGAARSTDRAQVVDRYVRETTLIGDSELGRKVFEDNCKACHTEHAETLIGPDLRTLSNRSPEFLLTAILDPSQAVEPRYVNYTLLLQSGELLVGVVKSEDSTSIQLANSEGKQRTILRSSIEELKPANVSLMPEGFETKISPDEMSHLLAYLDTLGAETVGSDSAASDTK
jgi:putative heme-binding domain-containing protein